MDALFLVNNSLRGDLIPSLSLSLSLSFSLSLSLSLSLSPVAAFQGLETLSWTSMRTLMSKLVAPEDQGNCSWGWAYNNLYPSSSQ